MEFLQRAYVRSIRSGEEVEHLVPCTYGSVSRAYFPDQTPYLLPESTPGPGASLWIFAFRAPGEEEVAPLLGRGREGLPVSVARIEE